MEEERIRNSESNPLVQRLHLEVEANLKNEQFSVEQLAANIGMSRSQLHRKLKQATGQSANQFIREYRLQRAMELLQNEDMTVSEIAFEVGFGSHSYFTTCFTEHYGYPPGEARHKLNEIPEPGGSSVQSDVKKYPHINKITVSGLILLGLFVAFLLYQQLARVPDTLDIRDKSIAVLPFKNMSGDPDQEFLCDGLTEEIIHHLGMIKSFDKVISHSSSMTFKNSHKTLTEIAQQLKINFVLEGSFRQSRNQIRITAQLIDAVNDNHLWSDMYERPVGDIFEIQSEIAKKIAAQFDAEISASEKLKIEKKPTENLEAYMYLKRGAYNLGRQDYKGGIDLIKKAIQTDPNLAEAYADLAQAYLVAGNYFLGDKSIQIEDPLPLIKKALTIDPELGRAYKVLGTIKHLKEWEFVEAEQAYKEALELDPKNYEEFLFVYGSFLVQMGRAEEAIPLMEKAVEVNPLNGILLGQLAKFYSFNDENQKAAEMMAKYEILFPNMAPGVIGVQSLYLDSLEKAIHHLEKVEEIPLYCGFLAISYAKNGQQQKAQELVERLQRMGLEKEIESLHYSVGLYYSGIGQKQEALYWLEKAYDSHDTELYWLKTEPMFKSLHGDPRYEDLLKRIGFPE